MKRVKSRMLVTAVLCAFAISMASAGNLMVGGDFTACEKTLGRAAFANGGRVSLHTEEYTWNKCGRLEVSRCYTNEAGDVTYTACAVIGTDGKTEGFPVTPGKSYDYSIEVRCDKTQHETLGCGISVSVWDKGIWKDMSRAEKSKPGQVVLKPTWTLFRGSFTVPEGKSRAGVQLNLWSSTKYPPVRLKIGDAIYFDNLKVEESQDDLAALKGAAVKKAAPVKTVKAVAPGVEFSDFVRFLGKDNGRAAEEAPVVRFELEGNDLVMAFRFESAKPFAPGTAKSPWSGGDTFEIFFGAVAGNPDRESTQLAFNPAGARRTVAGAVKGADVWTLERNEVADRVWQGRLRIPLAALGFTRAVQPGEVVPLNVAVSRKGGTLISWAPVVNGFGDVPKFGNLVLGTYSQAIKLAYRREEAVEGRAAYEKRVAELETAAKQAELDRFRNLAFTVARIPVDSDYGCPFVPRECFHPDREIVLKGAVNERLGLPIAVLNLRDHAETYVVRLETDTSNPARDCDEKQLNGTWGLKDFPPERITAREALRFKDTDAQPVTVRYNQLPKMNEACTITAPAGEAAVAWFDFDTAGVKPGEYRGRLRVIPLSEASEWKPWRGVAYHQRDYRGQMQDVPVTLVVRPIYLDTEPAQPNAFFQAPSTVDMFRRMNEIGTRDFMISPWDFQWERNSAGDLDHSRPKEQVAQVEKRARSVGAWAKEAGFRPTFLVGFSTYEVFKGLYGCKDDMEKAKRLWVQYLKGLKDRLNAWGIADEDYTIEVYDEPDPAKFAEAKTALSLAKKVLPSVRLVITLGAHIWSAEQLREMDPYIDGWILWQYGYFSRDDHLAYVKDALARGKTVWHYTCSTSGRAPIYPGYRIHPWFGYCHQLTGNQFFIIQDATGGFGTSDFKIAASSGILYRSFDSTMPSLRYMSMRRGVEDVKYLALLKKIAGDRPEVKKFLAEAPEKVIRSERHDQTTADRMREEAAELILRYSK